jgi:arabinogalactan endo-1,4-beta-galactosidase
VLILCLGHNGITQAQYFAKGADISWLTEMEAAGKKFYNSEGVQTECMALLKSLDMNAVRLRVWVNPTDGWCNAADLLVKARRASNLGMRIMIDFHYSDSWADPSKQTKPAAWTTYDLNGLKTAVANHTRDVLTLLKNNQIAVEWVQVGNETGNGMLWDNRQSSVSMSTYAALLLPDTMPVKRSLSECQSIVHHPQRITTTIFSLDFDDGSVNKRRQNGI